MRLWNSIKPWKWITAGTGIALFCGMLFVWWGTQQPTHHWRLAELALERRDLQGLNREIKYFQNQPDYRPHVHLLRGMVFLISERYPDAASEFNQSALSKPLKLTSSLLAGETFCRAGAYPQAQRILLGVVKELPENVSAHRWLAIAFYDVGANAHALQELQIVAALDPNDARPHRLIGLINKDAERFEEAIVAYQEALRRDQNHPQKEDILQELGESLAKVHKYAESLQTIEHAQPTARIWALRADCHYSAGDKAQAQVAAEEALKLDPQHTLALRMLGNLKIDQGQLAEAAVDFQRAITIDPSDFTSRFKLAQTYARLGKKAESEAEQQLSTKYRNLSERFTSLHVEAEQQPQNAELRYQLGQAARELYRPDLARMWFKAALGLNPQHIAARKALAELPHDTDS